MAFLKMTSISYTPVHMSLSNGNGWIVLCGVPIVGISLRSTSGNPDSRDLRLRLRQPEVSFG
ncbi:MAG: hypothetical protein D8M22_10880 [Armatimonadetes bacterium]|nr:hypothetical protein [Armatimonadota bacterium]RIK01358.1 MAG: hypothetical protein DCC46_02080 [Armatimonadota bacterium]